MLRLKAADRMAKLPKMLSLKAELQECASSDDAAKVSAVIEWARARGLHAAEGWFVTGGFFDAWESACKRQTEFAEAKQREDDIVAEILREVDELLDTVDTFRMKGCIARAIAHSVTGEPITLLVHRRENIFRHQAVRGTPSCTPQSSRAL